MLTDNFSMTKISDLTYKVVAISQVPNYNTDECVDWAIEMVSLGHETSSLLILAGLAKPTNYFQTIEYLRKALTELNLQIKVGDDAIISYSSYYIKKISQSENIRDNLKQLYEYCQSQDYEKSVFDFYLLYWAWDDIDYENEKTHYWENANKNNIEKIVIDTAKEWISKNQQHYAQQ
jgi:hypothetical protein